MAGLYPPVPKEALSPFIGQSLHEVPTPAAVIDLAAVKNNCAQMLSACESLQLGWRAHVKTHKTLELTSLQVGTAGPAKIVVSTLAELEFLLPLFQEYKSQGRDINILYGLPLGPAQVPRLAAAARILGENGISILIDHEDQLKALSTFKKLSGGVTPLIFIKIDMGGRRSGAITGTTQFHELFVAVLKAQKQSLGNLTGLYSHAGHSYGGDSEVAAISMLKDELSALHIGAGEIQNSLQDEKIALTLSVGASPTALSIQNFNDKTAAAKPAVNKAMQALHSTFSAIRSSGNFVEIHAGVYPLLDLQQLAAHSLSTSRLTWSDLAFTVLAEVASIYAGRGENGTNEVLVGAGGLALGREFCKAYPGMAKLTPWNRENVAMPAVNVEEEKGWQIGRFSQEHGILTWTGGKGDADALTVGQKVRLWPNHACITSSHFGWYYIVDSSVKGKEDEIVDVWIKARGW